MNTEHTKELREPPSPEDWKKVSCDCKTATESMCCGGPKPFDWTRYMPFIVCGIIIFIIFLAWLNSVWSSNIKPSQAPSPTQLTLFNVGACQYVIIAQDKAIAVVHRADCTNHLWQ